MPGFYTFSISCFLFAFILAQNFFVRLETETFPYRPACATTITSTLQLCWAWKILLFQRFHVFSPLSDACLKIRDVKYINQYIDIFIKNKYRYGDILVENVAALGQKLSSKHCLAFPPKVTCSCMPILRVSASEMVGASKQGESAIFLAQSGNANLKSS